ncbi:HDOD domain-containing protein [Candidatus Neomarinimicrobiota bacterium]
MTVNIQTIMSNAHNVASLPMIYNRINEVVNRSSSSMADIGAIISEDTGLSARILRLANSAFYGYPSQIDTIDRALTIIGIQQMRDLALATSMMHIFKDIPEDVINMNSFWEHSIACGVAARILAMQKREPNVERYFLGGILHDIGRLILLQQLPDEVRNIILTSKEDDVLVADLEIQEFGFDHAEIGAQLMHHWNLPDNLLNMVAGHHQPRKANQFKEAAAIIHFADLLAHTLQLGISGEFYIPRLVEESWEWLSFSPHVLPIVGDQIQVQYDSAIAIMLSD